MSGQLGQTVTYVDKNNNQDRATLINRAPGPGAWWAAIIGSQRTVKIAERTRQQSRRWYEVD